jgi:hypothetical protein
MKSAHRDEGVNPSDPAHEVTVNATSTAATSFRQNDRAQKAPGPFTTAAR